MKDVKIDKKKTARAEHKRKTRLNSLLKKLKVEKKNAESGFENEDLYSFLQDYLKVDNNFVFVDSNQSRTSSISVIENEEENCVIHQSICYEKNYSKSKSFSRKKYVENELKFNKDGTLTFSHKEGKNKIKLNVKTISKDNTITNETPTLEEILPKFSNNKTK